MKTYREIVFSKKIRILYRYIISKREFLPSHQKKITQNLYAIRSCCCSLLNIAKEYANCPKTEQGTPLLYEEIRDFAELSAYYFTEKNISEFLESLAQTRDLSYGEISCLIPILEWCCLSEIKECLKEKKGNIDGLIRSLHVLNGYDCSALAESLSQTEDVLNQDDVYPCLDDESKNLYRKKLQKLAKKQKKNERDTAVDLLKSARKESIQIGKILLAKQKSRWYFPVLIFTCVAILFLTAFITKDVAIYILSLIPSFISGKLICDTLFSRLIKSDLMPKIKINQENCPSTLVTIVSMVCNKNDAEKLLHRLDVLSYRIPITPIRLGLLLDFPESDQEYTKEDREIITFLEDEINQRNKQTNRFFCAVRKRVWSTNSFRYEAYGRKQGAMMDFSFLPEKKETFLLLVGNTEAEYMITLDADTEPTIDAVENLIGFMEHPNHKPVVKRDSNGHFRVVQGYGIAAPRVEANPETSYSTPYSAMMSGNSGTEFYRNSHFNLYQDLFSRGIFCGKGIIRLSLYRDLIFQRFYQDPLLSHDLPEGEILRCANLSDTVFFDEIPETVLSDEKRSHRWIRGDFQNSIFLFPQKNICNIFRFKVFHNLCRAWFPVSCFILLSFSIFFGAKGILTGLFWLTFPFLLRLPSLLSSAVGKIQKFHPFREFFDAIQETALNILLLPTKAFQALDGSIRGIVRSIRKKNKLEWTTAAASANCGSEISDYYFQLRWQLIGFIFLFSPYTILIGALWIVGPVIARQISTQYKKDTATDEEICKELKSMWKYYEDFMIEKHHYLPPDNYQQEPLNIVASRTSPTNIGLSLLAVLGAFDLGFIDETEFCQRIENTLNTIKILPKWKGHLYNWYDTETLKILNPKFISTVDCGNFAASLHTLSNGLVQQNSERCLNLAKTIHEILDSMDFSLLYDEKKKLFSIGYNEDEQKLSTSYYDLYASEARLTSYYAIMKRQISWKHWVQLARPAEKIHGDFVLSSWSGTMFEYFMPHLFLPAYRRTLSGETLRGILRAQQRNNDPRIPWGISESCYYTFDSLGNYQYRAFGIPSAALRRDLSFPKIISPYSTLLAYPWFPKQAEMNKKRLPKGTYGYFEAIDYRLGAENPRVVQCYMAHHLSMSFLALVNALTDHIMQKRFMSDQGEAFVSLLTEKVPAYSKNYLPAKVHEKERWYPSELRINRPDPEHPKVKLLSNSALTEFITDSGSGFLRKGDVNITKHSSDPQSPNGIFLFVRNKGSLYGTTYAPLYSNYDYSVFFDSSGATCYGIFSEFETRVTTTMHPQLPVSVRELTLKNNLMTESDFEFFLSADPILCPEKEYLAHPEYKDLFLTAAYDSNEKILSFSRKNKDNSELWISIFVSFPYDFHVSKDRISTPFLNDISAQDKYPIFPAMLLRGKINLRGKGTENIRFFIACAESKEDSFNSLKTAIKQSAETIQRRYSQMFDSLCVGGGIHSADRLIFDHIIPSLVFPWGKSAQDYKRPNNLPIRHLWKFGISGDYPILAVRIGNDTIARILPFIKTIFLLNHAAFPCDLVFLYREEEGYQTPLKTALDSLLGELEEPIRNRIFALNLHSVEEYLLIQKCSHMFINLDRGWKWKQSNRTFRPILRAGTPINSRKTMFSLVRGGFTNENSYFIPKQGRQPHRPWSLILSNHRLGTLINERSLGYTFADNASENQITPRHFGTSFNGETLYAVIRGKRYNLLYNASVEFFENRAVYRINLFGNVITTEVSVLSDIPAKVISITLSEEQPGLTEIVYQPRMILGKQDPSTVYRFSENEKIFFENKGNYFYGNGYCILFGFHSSQKNGGLTFHPKENGNRETFVLAYGYGRNSVRQIAEILTENRISKELKKLKDETARFITINTPDEALNAFVNGLLQQQIIHSRILGRTGPSQPGGAYGFRDQLQDSLCLATFQPSYLKRQIIRCCFHQFEEGDVMHWWHPRPYHPDDGIKTRFSDDPFWLVFACGEYYKITKNTQFFKRSIPYMQSTPLEDEECDRYFSPERTAFKESIYQHCLRAIRFALKTGSHGLILMGSGDWNDGMNGVEPGSETIWGTMFAIICLSAFEPLAKLLGTEEEHKEITSWITELRRTLDLHSFTNDRFIRGLRKNDTPFGGTEFIDLLPQAFAVFSKMEQEKTEIALTTAYQRLWDPNHKIIKLLDPPYQREPDGFPGTIAEYPPGVRENGGQYTHGGVWFARALLEQGRREEGYEILSGINPVNHHKKPRDSQEYGAEPYVLAADVYSLSGREGFAGWTHYTGAAGWYLKTVTESLLGIRREGDFISVSPNIPNHWNGYRAAIKIENDRLEILVERGTDKGIFEQNNKIPAIKLNGSDHQINVII